MKELQQYIKESLLDMDDSNFITTSQLLEISLMTLLKSLLQYTKKLHSTGNSITLIFDKKPISLHGWKVRDAQGITTLVTLSDIKPETNFSENLFKITRTKGIGNKKSKSKYY